MAVTHGPVRHAEFFVDKAASFALGWIGIYSAIMPGELAATALIMNYWTDINLALWISIFGVVIVATNLISIKFFGRFEYVAGALKLLLVVMLIIVGLVIDLGGAPGQERLGFRYWKESPFQEFHLSGDLGKFLAWYKALSGVVYSFGGVQLFNFFSGETQNPRKSLFKAARRVLIRTFTLYVLAILILSLIVSSNDESIASSTGTAEGSPWVIAIKRAGINVLPHVINAIVLTSAFSAANLGLVHCLRGLFALASVGNAPKIFLKTNSRGIPMYGIAFGALFLPLCYMSVSETSANVFNWFQNITSGYLLLGWVFIAVNHLSMVRALHAQGYTRDVLPYKIKGGVYFSVFSLVMSTVFLLTQGFSVFLEGQWSTSKFITTYLVLPVFFSLALFWKIYKKTKFVNPAEVDLQALFDDIENHPEPPLKKLRWWQYVTVFWI